MPHLHLTPHALSMPRRRAGRRARLACTSRGRAILLCRQGSGGGHQQCLLPGLLSHHPFRAHIGAPPSTRGRLPPAPLGDRPCAWAASGLAPALLATQAVLVLCRPAQARQQRPSLRAPLLVGSCAPAAGSRPQGAGAGLGACRGGRAIPGRPVRGRDRRHFGAWGWGKRRGAPWMAPTRPRPGPTWVRPDGADRHVGRAPRRPRRAAATPRLRRLTRRRRDEPPALNRRPSAGVPAAQPGARVQSAGTQPRAATHVPSSPAGRAPARSAAGCTQAEQSG